MKHLEDREIKKRVAANNGRSNYYSIKKTAIIFGFESFTAKI